MTPNAHKTKCSWSFSKSPKVSSEGLLALLFCPARVRSLMVARPYAILLPCARSLLSSCATLGRNGSVQRVLCQRRNYPFYPSYRVQQRSPDSAPAFLLATHTPVTMTTGQTTNQFNAKVDQGNTHSSAFLDSSAKHVQTRTHAPNSCAGLSQRMQCPPHYTRTRRHCSFAGTSVFRSASSEEDV